MAMTSDHKDKKSEEWVQECGPFESLPIVIISALSIGVVWKIAKA